MWLKVVDPWNIWLKLIADSDLKFVLNFNLHQIWTKYFILTINQPFYTKYLGVKHR